MLIHYLALLTFLTQSPDDIKLNKLKNNSQYLENYLDRECEVGYSLDLTETYIATIHNNYLYEYSLNEYGIIIKIQKTNIEE